MKLAIDRRMLTDAVCKACAVIPAKQVKPVLAFALLSVSNGNAKLEATDCEITVCYHLGKVNCRSVEVLIPLRHMADILRESRDETVLIEMGDKILTVSMARSRFNMPTADVNEFPTTSSFNSTGYFAINSARLREMIKRVVFCVGEPKGSKYAATEGVLFDVTKQALTLVATDTRRLSLIENQISIVSDAKVPEKQVIVPRKAVTILEAVLPDTADDVEFAVSENQVVFKTPIGDVTSRLLEGRFPRFMDVIPKSHEFAIDVACGPLHAAFRQSIISTDAESRGVNAKVSPGMLTLLSESKEIGNSEVELPISTDTDDFVTRIDPRFVSDFLKVLPADKVLTVQFKDSEAPVVFKTDDASIYVVMTMYME